VPDDAAMTRIENDQKRIQAKRDFILGSVGAYTEVRPLTIITRDVPLDKPESDREE
jgi:hypothetical protein